MRLLVMGTKKLRN